MSLFSLRWLMPVALLSLSACGGGGGSSGGLGGRGPSTGAPTETPCSASSDERLQAMSDAGIRYTSQLGLADGRYALPDTPAPTQLVVMFHGNHNNSCSWRNHLRRAAQEYGAVAVAMDYTGQETRGEIENYGWFMRAGAADSIAAAQYFLERYPSITQVFAMGISMGANAAGVAIASPEAVRADGSPLFDYWVAVEGVHNLIEEYLIIRAVAPVVPSAVVAQQEMEEENGGTLEEVPDRYVEITNVLRAPDMSYLKGAVMVHAIDDGLVPTTQSREMTLALNAAGVPTHLYTVGGKGDGEAGTTATAILMDPLLGGAGQEYESPFAGHGWEGSDTHLVTRTGFEQLYALMSGATDITPGETPVPGF
jgi:acetyl esterase/lipase